MEPFDKNNITNVERMGDNFGMSSYLGFGAQQNHNAYEVFYNFLKDETPKRILEIGTGIGGFIYALGSFVKDLDLDTQILTYDIAPFDHRRLNDFEVDARVENIFNDNYTQVTQEVIDFVQQDGVTIVLCDGVNKINEFTIFSQHIKSGDFILAHDYSPNFEHFQKHVNGKIWNWFEIHDDQIESDVIKYNLVPYKPEIFQEVVWVCKNKL